MEVVDEDRLLDCAALLHQRHDDLPGPCLESNLTLEEREWAYREKRIAREVLDAKASE